MVASIVGNAGRVVVSLCLLTILATAYRSLFLEPESAPAEALRLVTHRRVSITQPMHVSFLLFPTSGAFLGSVTILATEPSPDHRVILQ